MKHKVSPEVEAQAMRMAKSTQKMGQTKEQTKLIAQGIEKGIAEYKKTAKNKQREADKANKKKKKQQTSQQSQQQPKDEAAVVVNKNNPLPWGLLVLSWAAFAAYFLI